jgi:transcriptional regulator GlxA family with amidase domain
MLAMSASRLKALEADGRVSTRYSYSEVQVSNSRSAVWGSELNGCFLAAKKGSLIGRDGRKTSIHWMASGAVSDLAHPV